MCDGENCSVARALSVVGDRWSLLVLHEAFLGTSRFDQFQRSLGIARNVLATRLQALVGHGILSREQYQERPARYEYRLTDKGLDLYPALLMFMQWADRHIAGRQSRPIAGLHPGCPPAHPVVTCSHCGGEIDGRAALGSDEIDRLAAAR